MARAVDSLIERFGVPLVRSELTAGVAEARLAEVESGKAWGWRVFRSDDWMAARGRAADVRTRIWVAIV